MHLIHNVRRGVKRSSRHDGAKETRVSLRRFQGAGHPQETEATRGREDKEAQTMSTWDVGRLQRHGQHRHGDHWGAQPRILRGKQGK